MNCGWLLSIVVTIFVDAAVICAYSCWSRARLLYVSSNKREVRHTVTRHRTENKINSIYVEHFSLLGLCSRRDFFFTFSFACFVFLAVVCCLSCLLSLWLLASHRETKLPFLLFVYIRDAYVRRAVRALVKCEAERERERERETERDSAWKNERLRDAHTQQA